MLKSKMRLIAFFSYYKEFIHHEIVPSQSINQHLNKKRHAFFRLKNRIRKVRKGFFILGNNFFYTIMISPRQYCLYNSILLNIHLQ
ncbi:hypothetical protein X975_16810, partial [Stegodyphus mimosarum]